MTEPRKSTVYDYSDLRLHPDGTRVYQKSTNLRPKLAQGTIQDARLNWIATDAGGSANVPLFRKKKGSGLQEDGAISSDGEHFSVEADDDDVDRKGKRKLKRTDYRTIKRRKFLENDDYLAGDAAPPVAESSDANVLVLPYPSPDLLKSIHRFASKFYTERGQLLNSSRQYRKERKERRIKRAMNRESSHSSTASRSKSPEKVDGDEEGLEEEPPETDGGDIDKTPRITRGKTRKGRHRTEKLYVDMYKMFDGSAMMALGMLVQEHVAHLLNPSIPESWDREIRSAYTDPWGDSPQAGKGDGRAQNLPEDGKELRKVIAGDINKEQKGSSSKESPEMVEEEALTDDDSSRSEDTERSSSPENEYR